MSDLKPCPPVVMDLNQIFIDQISEAAKESPWIDQGNYTMSDICSDLCDFLRNTRAAPKVKPLEVCEHWAATGIETPFGDYLLKENSRYAPEPADFLGSPIQQKKYHITLGGMRVAHTDKPEEFLSIAQADYERRILSALTSETET